MSNDLIPTDVINLDFIADQLQKSSRLKSAHTRRGYLADLRDFESWRAGRPLSKLLVEQYAAELLDADRSPNTINRKLAAIRWWARRVADLAAENRGTTAKEAQRIAQQAERAASVSDITGSRSQRGRMITSGELGALLQACEVDPTPAGARDAAMIALAWSTGARRDEIAGLELVNFTPDDSNEGAELVIKGKGDKVRIAYIYNGALIALLDWLAIRGQAPGPIFVRINKGNKLSAQRLSGESMRMILDKRILTAGVKPLTWHDFRRSFASNLLDEGTDLVTVQKLMGHSNPTTTSNYDRRGDEVKRKAVKKLFVPYRRRG